jgi:putative ABC transport system permease protein
MIFEMLREAWRAMAANRLRTFLTMLGMMIGVGAVVLMLAIGQGAQFVVQQTIATMGSNLFIVQAGWTRVSGARGAAASAPTLTLGDVQAIARLSTVSAAAPLASANSQLVYGSMNWNAQVAGTTPEYFTVRS